MDPTPKKSKQTTYKVPTPPWQDSDFIDEYEYGEGTQFPLSTQCEEDAEHDLRDLEGLYKNFFDPDSDEDFELREEESSDSIFHSDGSNIDEFDDDLVFDKKILMTWVIKC